MTTPVTLGATRQMWFANLSDATPQWSFLEDPAGTTKRGAVFGQSIRLGDPINLGPQSTWHQLTWEGGEGQDIWKDNQMYQWGSTDVLTKSGKMRMWPGFQSWWKDEKVGVARRLVLQQGTRTDQQRGQLLTDLHSSVLYFATGDRDVFEAAAPAYFFYQLHPGYPKGDDRAVQIISYADSPYRFIAPILSDDGGSNVQLVATANKMFVLVESTHSFVQDTGAPTGTWPGTANNSYGHDSCKDFGSGMYYLFGNKLQKRVGKPPYGVIGTHTTVKKIPGAYVCRGLEVWNNRIYFGAMYPNGKSAVFVSDGATTTKAFDLPQQTNIIKLKAIAGSLYIMAVMSNDVHGNTSPVTWTTNLQQQVWRYDGRSLKLLWHQGDFSDGDNHWPSDLAEYNGWVVWGRQGTPNDGAIANLVFYDPVRDAIVRGPSLSLDGANVGSDYGRGLWIASLHDWHGTLAVYFKDDTDYAHNLKRPGVLCTMRPDTYVNHDLRWHTKNQTGDVAQFKADVKVNDNQNTLVSSEYHGTDEVAVELKTWLNIRLRYRITGANARIKVWVLHPNGAKLAQLSDATLLSTVTYPGDTNWHDVIIPIKDGSGNYFKTQKLQWFVQLQNTSANYDDTNVAEVDDVAVQWFVAPKKRRQWQVRIPVTENQNRLDGTANPLTSADALADQLETLYFNGNIVKFWEPDSSSATPGNGAYVECKIEDFHRVQSRLASNVQEEIGYCTLTLVENVLS